MKNIFPQDYLGSSQTIAKLKKQHTNASPRLVVADFDGTLFTPNIKIIPEILQHNRQMKKILQQQHIPLIINTGKKDWLKKQKHDAHILGIYPDTIIVGAGTKIYHKTAQGTLVKDTVWEAMLGEVVILEKAQTWNNNTVYGYIDHLVQEWQKKQKILLKKIKDSEFQLRYRVRGILTQHLPDITASLQKKFSSGIKVVYTESVYSNTFGFPTGDIIIVPDIAGKDTALQYLLEQYTAFIKNPLEVYCFGDGALDLNSFLRMPSTPQYLLKQFLVHPTTLAKHIFHTSFSHKPTLLTKSGSRAILSALDF